MQILVELRIRSLLLMTLLNYLLSMWLQFKPMFRIMKAAMKMLIQESLMLLAELRADQVVILMSGTDLLTLRL